MKMFLLSTVVLFLFSGIAIGENKTLTWTSVGDDGMDGACSGYVIKRSADSAQVVNDWDNCILIDTIWNDSNMPAGQDITVMIEGLPDGHWYFGVHPFDDVKNESYSNIANITIDNVQPGCIDNLRFLP